MENAKPNLLEKKHTCQKCRGLFSDVEVTWTPFGWDCPCGFRNYSFAEREKGNGQSFAGGVEAEKKNPVSYQNNKTIPKLLFTIGVPSRSELRVIRAVGVYDNGKMICSCPARPSAFCHHKETILRRLKKLMEDIKTLNHYEDS